MTKTKLALFLLAGISALLVVPLGQAQTYTDLHDLLQGTGSGPETPNVLGQGQDGNFYSTMPSSFPGQGTTLVATTGGAVTATHFFQGTDGSEPHSGLALGMDGNLYGTTYIHTTNGWGEVFQGDFRRSGERSL